jgi:hypothetical protein
MKGIVPAGILALATASIAHAQQQSPLPPSMVVGPAATIYSVLSARDLKDYCVYNDRVFGRGSRICVAERTMQLCSLEGWQYDTNSSNCSGFKADPIR